jgi:hypothetical protein
MERYKYWGGIGAGTFIGLMFVSAGFGKLPHQGEYWGLLLSDYSNSIMLLRLIDIVKQWLPWMEIVLGSLLIAGIASKIAASFSSFLILGFIANNIWMISQGAGREPCGCFGKFEAFLGTLSAENALCMDLGMLVLILIIFLYYPGNFFSIRPWFLQRQS